jgi:intracellular sulfur oxidation DsrE/DsrF family protein
LSRKISVDKLLMESKVVPYGVVEVAKLQANEKFVYLRP